MAIPIIIPRMAPTGKISAFIATRTSTAVTSWVIILATNEGKAKGRWRFAFPPYGPQGQRPKAAALLGASRVTLWKWLKEYNEQVETVVHG